jgi:hypothetical protein
LHIEGKCNAITDIPLCLFGSNPLWKCNTDSNLLTLFNSMFHLPNQQSWTVFHMYYKLVTSVTLALQMKPFELDGWRQLPKVERHVGNIGVPTSNLWGWIRTFSTHRSRQESNASQGLQHKQDQDTTDKDGKSKVARSVAQSWPLARQLPWPAITTQQR